MKNMGKKLINWILCVVMVVGMLPTQTHSVAAASNRYAEAAQSLDSEYAYSEELGAIYSPEATTFRLWAPTATAVDLNRYATGSDGETGAENLGTIFMEKLMEGDKWTGVWTTTVHGDIRGSYYTYTVKAENPVTKQMTTSETGDPYARSAGVDGKRSMIVDLDATDPDGWENDNHVLEDNQSDCIVWQVSIEDFSSNENSGVPEEKRGKYLAFTESDTTLNEEGQLATCVDYLKNSGVTTVELLPFFDSKGNFNVPEGTYSSNPYDGAKRINECKQMIKALHDAGISVVMGVDYGYIASTDNCFNGTVPTYYFHMTDSGEYSDGSGHGNETASERFMYRRYMIESVLYWANEYHIDGFRFTQMGLHDTETMNLIREELDGIDPRIMTWGEGWTEETSDYTPAVTCTGAKFYRAMEANRKHLADRMALFNRDLRTALCGSIDSMDGKGWLQGATVNAETVKSLMYSSEALVDSHDMPENHVTYVTSYTGETLWDRLCASQENDGFAGHRETAAQSKLSGAMLALSQGVMYLCAGDEMGRSGDGAIDWSMLVKNGDIASYFQGMMNIRKSFTPLHCADNHMGDNLYADSASFFSEGAVLAAVLTNDQKGEWSKLLFIANSSGETKTVEAPAAYDGTEWVIIANGRRAGLKKLDEVSDGKFTVEPRSVVVAAEKQSFESAANITDNCSAVNVSYINQVTGETFGSVTLTGEIGRGYSIYQPKYCSEHYVFHNAVGELYGTFSDEDKQVILYYGLPLSGSGIKDDPYKISSIDDWNALATFVADGGDTCGIYFEQTADIPQDGIVKRMIGTENTPFMGIYDGKGKTLKVDIDEPDSVAAPFRSINGATIKNLVVAGTIFGGDYSACIVGIVSGGENVIDNCFVSSSTEIIGHTYAGGILGSGGKYKTTIQNCVFDGKSLNASNGATIWGWSEDGSVPVLKNCLDISEVALPVGAGCVDPALDSNAGSMENIYYTCAEKVTGAGTWSAPGMLGYTVSGGDDVTVILDGATGLAYDGVIYGGKGETISLTLSGSNNGYEASAGTLNGSGSAYTLIMPAENVTVSKKVPLATSLTIKAKDQKIDNIISSPEYVEMEGLLDGHTLYSVKIAFDPQSGRVFPSDAVIHDGSDGDVTEQYNITYEPGTAIGEDRMYFTVTFVVKNGAWNNGKTENKVVTLSRRKDEDLLLVLRMDDIPAVGERPDYGYSEGVWDAVPSDNWAISRDLTYTYSYIQKPLAEITSLPSRNDSTYNGTAQKLLKDNGEASGGTLQYTLGTTAAPTGSWSTQICTGTDAGKYQVWVKAAGDADHSDSTAQRIKVEIAQAWLDLQPASGSWVYDGQEHTAPEVTVKEGTGTQLYGEDRLVATASGSVTNVSDTADGNNEVSPGYKVMRGDEDVTGNYDILTYTGTLTITKRDVTVSVEDAITKYNGSEQSGNTELKFTGVLDSHTAAITYTPAKGTLAGTTAYEGSFGDDFKVTDADGKDVTANYKLTKKTAGKLTISNRSDKYVITVKANSNTGNVYDGTVYSAKGFETLEFTVENNKYTVEGLTTSDPGSKTVCNLTNAISGTAIVKDVNNNDVTDQFTINTEDGTLEITQKAVTITAGSDSKVYDGTALMKDSYTNTALAEGDSIESVIVTGSQTVVGSSDNVPSAAKIVNAGGDDVTSSYAITYVNGTLEITQDTKAIVITSASNSWTYDGEKHFDNTYTVAYGGAAVTADQTGKVFTLPTGDKVTITPTAEGVRVYDKSYDQNNTYTYELDHTDQYDSVTANYGTLGITQKAVTITAGSDSKVYDGTALTKKSYTNTALAEGDSIEGVTITGSQMIVGSSNNVPSDAKIVNASGEDVTSSYAITYANGTLEIQPKAATVTADAKNKMNGTADPMLTATVTGLIGSDKLAYILEREVGELPGTYVITSRGERVQGNYVVTYVPATLTIHKEYEYDLVTLLKMAIAQGGEQTVYWEQGHSLPYVVMKILEEHPSVTLVFKYSYEGINYDVTIPGKYVKANTSIPWYGPIYLYQNYGKYSLGAGNNGKPEGVRGTYVVRRGDNLSKIARRLHVTVRWLIQLNNIKNPNLIWANQVLKY